MDDSRIRILAAAICADIEARLERRLAVQPTLSLAEAAKQLGVSIPTLHKWIEQDKIPVIHIGQYYRIRPIDINTYLEKHIK